MIEMGCEINKKGLKELEGNLWCTLCEDTKETSVRMINEVKEFLPSGENVIC